MTKTRIISTILLLLSAITVIAQTIISGKVTDSVTGQPLGHVSVKAEGMQAQTVTNEDGNFSLKLPSQPQRLMFSHIGYNTYHQQISNEQKYPIQIQMSASTVKLSEIVVQADNPQEILRAAMAQVKNNYPSTTELLRCFYRETVRRGNRFISISEAVADVYKTAYSYDTSSDAVAIVKGRRLMSMKARDTLGVKMQGGPMMSVVADVVKNPEYMLNSESLAYCTMRMELPELIDGRLNYVINISPIESSPYPLLGGRLSIEQASLIITRAELQLDVSNWRKASDYILVHKPLGLRFRPKKLTMTIVYSTDSAGVTRISYLRNELRFNCDWKRRLFASAFDAVNEMVITERIAQGKEVQRPRGRNSFGLYDRFYDRVDYFDDPEFWKDYNIIEPTESLEHAIDKLKKTKK